MTTDRADGEVSGPAVERTEPAIDAGGFAVIAIEVLETLYPYSSGHVALGPDDTDITPDRLHPAFHGALDWHSSVHMQWSLLRLLRTAPGELEDAGVVAPARALLSQRLTAANLSVEVQYLRDRPSFERPYGWAWALMLAAEARRHPDLSASAAELERLTKVIEANTTAWLPRQAYPIRHGKHQNDAFALTLMWEAAGPDALDAPDLREAIRTRAVEWFAPDVQGPADTSAEPSGSDFLSPALTEAVLMRRVLGSTFDRWWATHLPDLGSAAQHRHLLDAPTILDASDGQFVHLAGLALSRAWQLRELAEHSDDSGLLIDAATHQTEAVIPLITGGDFMATHWLVSFALLATQGLSA